jgi:hypothetical protein
MKSWMFRLLVVIGVSCSSAAVFAQSYGAFDRSTMLEAHRYPQLPPTDYPMTGVTPAPARIQPYTSGATYGFAPAPYSATQPTMWQASQGAEMLESPYGTTQPPTTPIMGGKNLWEMDDCGTCDVGGCCAPCGPVWLGTVGGLMFTRNDPDFKQLSFDDTNLVGQTLSTDSGLGRWDPGPELRLGWYLSPCRVLEFAYWGVYGDPREATSYAADLVGNLNSAMDFSPLNIGAANVNDLYDAAQVHRVYRRYNVNNFEVNLLSGDVSWLQCQGCQIRYLAGIRYLRFNEDFEYASADASPFFGVDPANEAYYEIDVENHLWGLQLGGRGDWHWTPRFSVFTGAKFGLYGNYMEHHSRIYNVNGVAVVGPGNPLAGQSFDIPSNKTVAAFIGEIDLGINYRFAPRWSAMLGYRAVAISGVAYATEQIPGNLADLPGVESIDNNANMILHGAYAGVTFGW